ncbi:hypothetical protein Dimus_033489 [Dionaea muscipula]
MLREPRLGGRFTVENRGRRLPFSRECLEERRDNMPSDRGGDIGAPVVLRYTSGGILPSYEAALQGGHWETGEIVRTSRSEPSPIIIFGESLLDGEDCRARCSLVFEDVMDFGKVLSLNALWWASRGFSMKPWSEDAVILSKREVWIRCHGVPFHARCPSTFVSIGKQWPGDVLSVEFGSVESGVLDEGRINILTDALTPFNFAFTLMVDGKEFACREVEDGSANAHLLQDCLASLGTSIPG